MWLQNVRYKGRVGHYSHDCAASQVAPAQAAYVLSVPAPACSEFETPTGSSSQAFLPVHAAPAPPVQCTHSTLNTHMQQCFTFLLKHNGTLLRVCAVAQTKLHCQNPTVSWNYAHLQQQPHSNTPHSKPYVPYYNPFSTNPLQEGEAEMP